MCLSGCSGSSSTLAAAGLDAQRTAELFWWMAAVSIALWLALSVLLLLAIRGWRPARPDRTAPWLIVGGGVILPTVVLAVLLVAALPPLFTRHVVAADALHVEVIGEQWWWRVRYRHPGGAAVELANELRLPRGRQTRVQLGSDNVIHAFWVPALAGKVDMIPGRTTFLTLEPTMVGEFRGVCAEYCGDSHARMAFTATVVEPQAFSAWLSAQQQDAAQPGTDGERRGRELFVARGCGACHTVRGTDSRGRIGPDLTHFASRPTVAAMALANDTNTIKSWLRQPSRIKPGARMPGFATIGEQELDLIAVYLGGLR